MISRPVTLALAFGLLAAGHGFASPGAGELWTTLKPDLAGAGVERGVGPASFASLIERVRPAVVAIHNSGPARDSREGFPFNPWRLFPEVPRREREEGIGSGFIIRADGYIVTNQHVVAEAESLTVRVQGLAAPLDAHVVGSDSRSDLALVKIEPPGPLPVIPLGRSDDLPIGAWVIAIGNPFGLTAVVTKGIVSGKGRSLDDLSSLRDRFVDFIQTDAAIDLGNSGGPLVNMRGEVVGINTAINSRARGIGFAVPSDLVKAVLPHLYKEGRLRRSYLGISVDPVGWELSQALGLPDTRGVLIARVLADRPAYKAGLLAGDVLLEFNGMAIWGTPDVGWKVATAQAGKKVAAMVWRGGRRLTIEVTCQARRSEKAQDKRPREAAKTHSLGLVVVALDAKTARVSGLRAGTRGVVVVSAAADAAEHGIRVGDVITTLNDVAVGSAQELERQLSAVRRDRMIRFYIFRQRDALYVALPKRWE
ncbi:MAG TPA: trypsin-like peptidase domain-containing protein [Myxococcota bacterium]|nr:trypsin-like peptidase domain-containing protein [Myxococcota bacterium]